MCHSAAALAKRPESVHGYNRLFSGVPSDFRCSPDSRHLEGNVRFSTGYVGFTPESGPIRCVLFESGCDPTGHQRRADCLRWTTNGAQNIRAGSGTVVQASTAFRMRFGECRVLIDSLASCSQNLLRCPVFGGRPLQAAISMKSMSGRDRGCRGSGHDVAGFCQNTVLEGCRDHREALPKATGLTGADDEGRRLPRQAGDALHKSGITGVDQSSALRP